MTTTEGAGSSLPAPPDPYQVRYSEHQARKKAALLELMRERHSDRMFDDRPIPDDVLAGIVDTVRLCPSSCDRRAIHVRVVTSRDELTLLGGVLVGGVGWIHRAPAVALLFADPAAYKAAGEIMFMPYLDAGVVVQQLYLAATASGIACCFVNPNIRQMNRAHFVDVFGDGIFAGAFAMGYPR